MYNHHSREATSADRIDSNGCTTLGEMYCELVHVRGDDDPNMARWVNSKCAVYPRIVVPFVSGRSEEKRSIEIDCGRGDRWYQVASSWVRRLYGLWCFDFAFHRQRGLSETDAPDGEPSLTSRIWSLICCRPGGLRESLPATLYSEPSDLVRAFAWHRYLAVFAVALQNDVIRLYHLHAGCWSPLVLGHELQNTVMCMEWKPMSGTRLAVGTKHGVLIWSLTSRAERNLSAFGFKGAPYTSSNLYMLNEQGLVHGWRSASVRYFSLPHRAPVNALSWSPSGRWLATGSCQHGHVVIWDMAVETPTPLVQYCPGGVGRLLWSPNDQFLFASTTRRQFRIWETQYWISQRWTQLKYVESAAWSADGYHLAFTVKDDAKLYVLSLSPPTCDSPAVFNRQSVVTLVDVMSQMERERMSGEGSLGSIAWDDTSSRLAVAIRGRPWIALFQCSRLIHSAEFQYLGCIRGPAGTHVTHVGFRGNMEEGALLGAAYSNGDVAMYPMYFKLPTIGRTAGRR